jgi:prepilin-type N-terminal cleavage/methylation domain-containing protein
MTGSPQNGRSTQQGFSYLELMIAMVVLAVGLLGGIAAICAATAGNGRSKLHTTAATLAESTLEKIIALPQGVAGASAQTKMTDCQGNSFTVDTSPDPTASPLISTFGGVQVDFSQPPSAGYSMLYAVCSAGQTVSYDVRWRIDPGPTPATQLVTVSAKALPGTATPAAAFVPPVTLRGLRGAL